MSDFPILDLVAGIIFIYFLLSIICSSAVEIVLTLTRVRSKLLKEWLFVIFDKPVDYNGKQVSLGQLLIDHCAVTGLSGKGNAPTYIDAKNFTSALFEKITYNKDNPLSIANDLDSLVKSIEASPLLDNELKRTFLIHANEAVAAYAAVSVKTKSEIEIFKNKVELWYNSSMERLAGTLKRKYARKFTLLIAIGITLLLNADSISIAQFLYNNPEARTKLAANAMAAAQSDSIKQSVNNLRVQLIHLGKDSTTVQDSITLNAITDSINKQVQTINLAKAALSDVLPLGWNNMSFKNGDGNFSFSVLLKCIAGWAATVLAIMMGAPFWFDVLNKISNLRGTGNKPPIAPANTDTNT